jgi:hypothetical protein
VSKKWSETMWRLLTKFDFVRRKDRHYIVTDSQFSLFFRKMNPNHIISLTVYDYARLSQDLSELKAFTRLKKFSIPNLSANTIKSIIPHMTGLENLKLSCWQPGTDEMKEIGDYLKYLTKLYWRNYESRIGKENFKSYLCCAKLNIFRIT